MQANARVVGSNYTVFQWRGKSIAYLERFSDTGVRPIANVEEITPLGESHPVEFATPRALTGGQLTFSIRELWSKPVWQHLFGLAAANNILDVWDIIARDPSVITCQTIIKPPQGNYYRTKTYHNVVVSAIDDSEDVTLGSMTVLRNLSCMYTHYTRDTVAAA